MSEAILIIDLEATCWADDDLSAPVRVSGQDYPNETTEVGAALVSARTFEILSEYESFVRPRERPTLSAFCSQLTHIEQADVDGARPFPAVIAELAHTYRLGTPDEPIFASWGAYDRKQIISDCNRYGIQYPFVREHVNLKEQTAKRLGVKPRGVEEALNAMGLRFEGVQHRALPDVRNIICIVREVKRLTGKPYLELENGR